MLPQMYLLSDAIISLINELISNVQFIMMIMLGHLAGHCFSLFFICAAERYTLTSTRLDCNCNMGTRDKA